MTQRNDDRAQTMIEGNLRKAVSSAFGRDVAIHAVPVGFAFAAPGGVEDEGLYAVRREAGLWRIEDSGTLVPALVAEGRLPPGRHAEFLAMLDEVGLAFDYGTMTISGSEGDVGTIGGAALALANVQSASLSRFRRPAAPDVLLALVERFSEESGPDCRLDGHAWIALGLFADLEEADAEAVGLLASDPEAALSRAFEGGWPPRADVPSKIPAFSGSIDAAVTVAMRLGLDETSAGEWLDRAIASMRSDGFDPVWSNPEDIARALMCLLLKDLAGARSSN